MWLFIIGGWYNKYNECIINVVLYMMGDVFMPMKEKEININLFYQLDMLERIKRAKEKGEKELEEQLELEESQIKRKLYQQPPLQE